MLPNTTQDAAANITTAGAPSRVARPTGKTRNRPSSPHDSTSATATTFQDPFGRLSNSRSALGAVRIAATSLRRLVRNVNRAAATTRYSAASPQGAHPGPRHMATRKKPAATIKATRPPSTRGSQVRRPRVRSKKAWSVSGKRRVSSRRAQYQVDRPSASTPRRKKKFASAPCQPRVSTSRRSRSRP